MITSEINFNKRGKKINDTQQNKLSVQQLKNNIYMNCCIFCGISNRKSNNRNGHILEILMVILITNLGKLSKSIKSRTSWKRIQKVKFYIAICKIFELCDETEIDIFKFKNHCHQGVTENKFFILILQILMALANPFSFNHRKSTTIWHVTGNTMRTPNYQCCGNR